MVVPVQTPFIEYTANGVTKSFALDFNCDKAEYLIVTLDDNEAPVGSWSLLNDTVTFNSAPVNGVKVVLQRNTPFQRTANYQSYDNSFRPTAVNKDFDLIWWKLQELGYRDQVIWLALVKEISDRIAGDENLQNQINTIDEWLTNLQENVDQNTSDIAQLVTDLSKEIADRIKGDQILKDMFLSMIDEAINEGTINALAVTHVDSLDALEAIANVWDGRTVYVKDLGHYEYDAATTTWVKAYQDADNVKYGGSTQKDFNLQQESINTIVLDPNLAPLGWTQKDFNDTYVDVRKFIKKDRSNATAGLQSAIEKAYGGTLLIPIPLQILDTIHVEKGLTIKGTNRSVSSYANELNVLEFGLLGANKNAFEIATTSGVIGFNMESLFLRGSRNGGNALKMGSNITNSLADFNIKDLIIYNFSKGIEKTFCWDGRYENMRIQACVNGITHNSQSNAILYDKCAIVTIDNMLLEFSNSEGVQFECCDISNALKTNGSPISLFQSSVAFNTGYFENISNASLAQVGTTGEVNGSRLSFNTPFKLGKNVIVGSNLAFVNIVQPDSNNIKVIGATLTTEVNAKVTPRNSGKVKKSVYSWNPKQPLTIAGYGGVTATYQDYRNYLLLNSTNVSGGWNITNSLEVGKVYTIVYSIRKTANTVGLSLRHPSTQSVVRANEVGESVTIKTISFIATDTVMNMTWSGDIELYGIDIVEGNLSEFPVDPFKQNDFDRPVTICRNNVPTTGTWRIGDKVENANPTTHAGWICTTAGTPGTWKQYGAIV